MMISSRTSFWSLKVLLSKILSVVVNVRGRLDVPDDYFHVGLVRQPPDGHGSHGRAAPGAGAIPRRKRLRGQHLRRFRPLVGGDRSGREVEVPLPRRRGEKGGRRPGPGAWARLPLRARGGFRAPQGV